MDVLIVVGLTIEICDLNDLKFWVMGYHWAD